MSSNATLTSKTYFLIFSNHIVNIEKMDKANYSTIESLIVSINGVQNTNQLGTLLQWDNSCNNLFQSPSFSP